MRILRLIGNLVLSFAFAGCAVSGGGAPRESGEPPRASDIRSVDSRQARRLYDVMTPLLRAMDHPKSPREVRIGVMDASVMAIYDGWRVIYFGADLPAEEIAAAIEHRSVSALALSIVFPPDDPNLMRELKDLKRLIHPNLPVIVGGKSVEAYHHVLKDIGAIVVHSLEEFRDQLQLIRL